MAFLRLSRRIRWVLAALLIVALAAGLLLVIGVANPRITLENYRRIHKGMSRADVTAILGSEGHREEPRWHEWMRVATRQPPHWTLLAAKEPGRGTTVADSRTWSSLDAHIQVQFDDEDRVCGSLMLIRFDPMK